MNRGFSYYFRSGMSSAAHALKGESFMKRFSLLIYFLMSFIGKLLIFTRPIFVIADVNLTAMVKDCRSFSFSKIFQNCADGRRYRNLLLFYFIKDFIVLAGAALIMLPIIILWPVLSSLLAGGILHTSDYEYAIVYYMTIALTVGLAVTSVVFVILFELNYIPAGYLSACSRRLDVSDYLYNSKQAMHGLKWTFFLVHLVYFLIIFAILGVIIGSVACLLLYSEYAVGLVISIVLILGSLFLLIYFIQVFLLAGKTSTYLMCKYSASLESVLVVAENMDETETVRTVLDQEQEPEEVIEEKEEE